MCCGKRGNNTGPPTIGIMTNEQMAQMSTLTNPRQRQWLEIPLPGTACIIA